MTISEEFSYIDQDRVMTDAAKNNFDYLVSFLTTHYSVHYLENGRTLLIKHGGQFPTKWLSYLKPPETILSMRYKIDKPPSLFHYIVKYNRTDVLTQLDNTETFRWACKGMCRYGISWLFLAEALWQGNESFILVAWRRLEEIYNDRDVINIHWLFIEDPKLFIYLLRIITRNNNRPFSTRVYNTLVTNFKKPNYTIDEDWFQHKETRAFFRKEIASINKSSRDPLVQWYKFREYEQTVESIEVILAIVLDAKVSSDLINYIIVPYVM
jgi:hypothetical protein